MAFPSLVQHAKRLLSPLFSSRAKSYGNSNIASLLSHGSGMGVLVGAWTDSRIEQVRHYKHWIYVAIRRIGDRVSHKAPNISLILDPTDPRNRNNPHPGGSDPFPGADPFRVPRPRYSPRQIQKALTPIQAHEHVEPVGTNHPLARLLRKPNDFDQACDLWFETVLFLHLTGNAYWWTPLNALNRPAEIWVLPSHWVWPVAGQDKIIEGYDIRPVEGNYIRRFFPAEEVIHFRYKSPISKIDGYGPTTAGAQWLDVQESIDRTRWFSYKNGAFPGVAIEFGGTMMDPSDDDMRRIEAKFIARYAGETRANKPLFLPPGVSLKKLSVSPAEMDYVNSSEQIRDHILALFGVPPTIAGLNKQMTYGSITAANANFYSVVINPLLNFLSQVITNCLASRWDPRLRVWWEDLTPDDPALVEKQIMTDFVTGARTTNEIRSLRGMEPYPDPRANDPLVQGGLVRLPYVNGGEVEQMGDPTGQPAPSNKHLSSLQRRIRRRQRILHARMKV